MNVEFTKCEVLYVEALNVSNEVCMACVYVKLVMSD